MSVPGPTEKQEIAINRLKGTTEIDDNISRKVDF